MNELDSERRLPVWRALSMLFLDTELQPQDYRWISEQLAGSGYSRDEAWNILVSEVAPAFSFNLMDVAGEWLGWTEAEVAAIMNRSLSAGSQMASGWLSPKAIARFLEREWEKVPTS